MAEETALINMAELNAVEVFTGDAIDKLLKQIEAEVSGFVPNLKTAKSRAEITALATKVAKSKVLLDDLGKDLTAEWKEKSKVVDASRRQVRDFLDALKAKVRQPLTDWETAKKEEEAAAQKVIDDAAKAEADRIEAERLQKEKELEEREAAIKRAEDRAAFEADKIKQQQEADERAKEKAQESIKQEREDAERRVAQEKVKAEQADRARIEAEERAKIEQQQAVQKTKDDAAAEAKRVEDDRLAEVARLQAVEDARAANTEHRRKVNQTALSDTMISICCEEDLARRFITAIAQGKITNVTINY